MAHVVSSPRVGLIQGVRLRMEIRVLTEDNASAKGRNLTNAFSRMRFVT